MNIVIYLFLMNTHMYYAIICARHRCRRQFVTSVFPRRRENPFQEFTSRELRAVNGKRP